MILIPICFIFSEALSKKEIKSQILYTIRREILFYTINGFSLCCGSL